MSFFPSFGRKLLFRVEDLPLDPQELRYRFRRRVCWLTLILVLFILGIPVFEDRSLNLKTITAANKFIAFYQASQLKMAESRQSRAISLEKSMFSSWSFSEPNNCEGNDYAKMNEFKQDQIVWRIFYLAPGNESGFGQEVQSICLNPLKGIMVAGEPIASGEIHIFVAPEVDLKSKRTDRTRQIVIRDFGTEVFQMSYQDS